MIIGIGSKLYTDWLKNSPIEMLQDGSIVVDKVNYYSAMNEFKYKL